MYELFLISQMYLSNMKVHKTQIRFTFFTVIELNKQTSCSWVIIEIIGLTACKLVINFLHRWHCSVQQSSIWLINFVSLHLQKKNFAWNICTRALTILWQLICSNTRWSDSGTKAMIPIYCYNPITMDDAYDYYRGPSFWVFWMYVLQNVLESVWWWHILYVLAVYLHLPPVRSDSSGVRLIFGRFLVSRSATMVLTWYWSGVSSM